MALPNTWPGMMPDFKIVYPQLIVGGSAEVVCSSQSLFYLLWEMETSVTFLCTSVAFSVKSGGLSQWIRVGFRIGLGNAPGAWEEVAITQHLEREIVFSPKVMQCVFLW